MIVAFPPIVSARSSLLNDYFSSGRLQLMSSFLDQRCHICQVEERE